MTQWFSLEPDQFCIRRTALVKTLHATTVSTWTKYIQRNELQSKQLVCTKRNRERKPMFIPRLNGPKLDKTGNASVLKYGINYNTIKNFAIACFYSGCMDCLMEYVHGYWDSIKLTCMCLTNFTIELLCFRILITPIPALHWRTQGKGGAAGLKPPSKAKFLKKI